MSMSYRLNILPANIKVQAQEGDTVLDLLRNAGLHPDAPCGGKGSCRKCRVFINRHFCMKEEAEEKETVKRIIDGQIFTEALACQSIIDCDMDLYYEGAGDLNILEDSKNGSGLHSESIMSRGKDLAAAFDIGTTSVVCYILDIDTAECVARSSMLNPQSQFGADVISRCEYALEHGVMPLSEAIRSAMDQLMLECAEDLNRIKLISVVGNTCMHHLLLGIDIKSLTVAPYEAVVKDALVMKAADLGLINACRGDAAGPADNKDAVVRILPNIAGFVGSDTVACILSSRMDESEELTLMIDIGTNGEMVLGNKDRMICCSTAAGPAFEGAKIECGMRGSIGAIDHVAVKDGRLDCHIIGSEDDEHIKAAGICGSGILDAVAAALTLGLIDDFGKISSGNIMLSDGIYLSQKDIREVQLAKAAIAAGIELLSEKLAVRVNDIERVLIAGAFGNYMDPVSACAIGLIPQILSDKIQMIGNAAGEGSIMAALSEKAWEHAQQISRKTEFLELASSEDFQDIFVDNLTFDTDIY